MLDQTWIFQALFQLLRFFIQLCGSCSLSYLCPQFKTQSVSLISKQLPIKINLLPKLKQTNNMGKKLRLGGILILILDDVRRKTRDSIQQWRIPLQPLLWKKCDNWQIRTQYFFGFLSLAGTSFLFVLYPWWIQSLLSQSEENAVTEIILYVILHSIMTSKLFARPW